MFATVLAQLSQSCAGMGINQSDEESSAPAAGRLLCFSEDQISRSSPLQLRRPKLCRQRGELQKDRILPPVVVWLHGITEPLSTTAATEPVCDLINLILI